ncbi:MAG: hypothetical protein K8F30_15255, partial [Taibaiella sp.]|nr:hypothetical protein [Taibaiella sp.]
MDRNSVTGFLLLVLLLVGYIAYNNYSQSKFEDAKKADSVANAKAHPKPLAKDTVIAPVAPATSEVAAINDSIEMAKPPAFRGEEKTVVLENKDLAVEFTTKGAHPVGALLKNYKTYTGKPLRLFEGEYNK